MNFVNTRLLLRVVVFLITCVAVLDGFSSIATAQVAAAAAPSGGQLPEPVYWKQDLFLVPYQWSSAAEPAAAQAVWLFVSKDRGATWQKISEAKPQVKAFNYRAEGEGEYWFAIRTLDHHGRTWPTGPYQPELRVIVDTTIPRIDELRAQLLLNGQVQIAWRCSDVNLDANSLKIEAAMDAAGTWQTVPHSSLLPAAPISLAASAVGPVNMGQVLWQPAVGMRPVAIRAAVLDRAGNSATYQTEMGSSPSTAAPESPLATTTSTLNSLPPVGISNVPTAPQGPSNPSGWISGSAASTLVSTPASQLWPADASSRAPFRLSSIAHNAGGDGVTAYGDAPVISAPAASSDFAGRSMGDDRVDARYASTGPITHGASVSAQSDADSATTGTAGVVPLQPFRRAYIKRLPVPVRDDSSSPIVDPPRHLQQLTRPVVQQAAPANTKLVGSRTFSLEYDLDDAGRWGVTKVELWGSRDGGQTWHSFAQDNDHLSPLVVTVDEEGLYGFRIVVESAGSVAAVPPNPGDAPELWVAVDLHRPAVELTAIERGEGNLNDHLILRWRAADDNLEPRPIALFYSSRPTGPWSAIATSLEDTGEYPWRVERHVPARFYLRVEARDTAGNLAAFQTREPVEFAPLEAGWHLRASEPVGPTAIGADANYR